MIAPMVAFVAYSCLSNSTKLETIDLTNVGTCNDIDVSDFRSHTNSHNFRVRLSFGVHDEFVKHQSRAYWKYYGMFILILLFLRACTQKGWRGTSKSSSNSPSSSQSPTAWWSPQGEFRNAANWTGSPLHPRSLNSRRSTFRWLRNANTWCSSSAMSSAATPSG